MNELFSSEDALDSFIGGAVLGLGGGVIRKGAQAIASNKQASEIYGNGADLVTEALEIDPNNALAQKMQTKLDKGKSLSGRQINRLVDANENAMVSQDKGKIKSKAKEMLYKYGETGNIDTTAEVITKIRTGEKITKAERNILTNSKYGRRVSTEMNPDIVEAGTHNSSWVEDIGTERINADVYNRSGEKSTLMPGGKVKTNVIPPDDEEDETEAKISAPVSVKNADGKTVNTEIQSVEIDGDKASFTLSNGEKVGSDKVAFKSDNAKMVADIAVEKVSRVEGFSDEAATAMIKGYDGSISPTQYTMAFDEAFKMGASGVPSSKLTRVINSGVSERVAYTAYELGRQSTEKATSDLKSPSNNGIINTNESEAKNESSESIHLRNGSKRDGGKNTQGQVSRMERGTGQTESRRKTARIADSEAARLVNEGREVKVADLGILGGSNEQTVRVVDKANETSSMKEARKRAEARGLKVTFFVGDNLVIKDKSGEWISVRGYIYGEHVFVRADHSLYTADQITRHELGHDMIAKGEVDIKAVRERLEKTVGKENIDKLAEFYTEAYEGSGMSAEDIWEECICDSLGDMNIFAGNEVIGTFFDTMLPEIKKAASDTKAPTQTRGSPEGKASRDILNDEETSALLAYKSGGSYSINAKLREKISLSKYEQRIVDGLDKALEKLPVYKGKAYRNISFDGLGDKAARDNYVAEHIVGDIISYDAYSSSSTEIDGYPIDGDFVVHHIIQSVNGRNLAGYGNNFESEVLFARKSKYITDKIIYDKYGNPTIYLTEIANGQSEDVTGKTDGNVSGDNPRESKPWTHSSEESEVQRLSAQNTGNGEVQSVVSKWNTERDTRQGELRGIQTEDKASRELDSKYKSAEEAKASGQVSDAKFSIEFADDIANNQRKFVADGLSRISSEELEQAIADTAHMVDEMKPYANILPQDKVGKTLVKNGSYDISVENTTICIRTLAYNSFVDMVSEKVGRPLSQMESFLVSQKLYEIAKEPQCLYCYVSLDRKAFNEMIIRYTEQRDAAISAYEAAGKPKIPSKFDAEWSLFKDFLDGRKPTKNMWDRYVGWLEAYNKGERFVSLEDISTEAKRLELVEGGGAIASQVKDMLKYAQSASWAKKQTQYVAYYDEILKLKPTVIRNLNSHYGMRWYSFSDYSGAFIVENMQQITDAAIRGLKGLSYTKDTDFAEIFAPTGMNINISVYAKKGENGYEVDAKQSANIDDAIRLRNQYPNVGIVVVATDAKGVEWALSQEWSDVVIPFHTVRTGADVAEFYNWEIFNAEQNDTIADQNLWDAYVNSVGKKKVSKMVYPSEHQNDRDTYLRICEDRGLTPRFKSFLNNPNYMKLVNETRQSEGETQPLKPNYNIDAAERSFDKFVEKGGYYEGWYNDGIDVDGEAEIVAEDVKSGKKANEVSYGRQDINFDDLAKGRKTNRQHGKASRDFDTEYLSAVERGDMETAQRMVDEAAKEAGYDSPKLYHGTKRGGFTVFDDTKNDLAQKGFFFTSSPDVAKSYFNSSDGTLYAGYIRMEHPLIVEGHRREWNNLKFDIGDAAKNYKAVQRADGWWEIHTVEGRVNIENTTRWATREDAIDAYKAAPYVHPTKTVLNTTRDIVRYAYNNGDYDGVIIKDTIDMGDIRAKRKISTLYIPFNSNQIKSADPVTYDDNGNVIPLSERFNPKNSDIRYSRELDFIDFINEQAGEESDPNLTKAQNVAKVRGELEKMNVGKGEIMAVMKLADKMFDVYGGDSNISEFRYGLFEATKLALNGSETGFDAAYNIIHTLAREVAYNPKNAGGEAELLAEIKRDIRGTRMSVHEADKTSGEFYNYGGYGAFRKSHLGKFMLANDGIQVDVKYEELQNLYGNSFFPDVNTVSEQLMQMAKLMDTPLSEYMMVSEAELEATADEMVQSLFAKLGDIWGRAIKSGKTIVAPSESDKFSNRSLLVGALETAVQNDIERNKLEQYKAKIDLINVEEQKLLELRAKIKELSYNKGLRDTEAIKKLQFEANQAANRINTYDRQLLNLESTKALKGVLEREKTKARKKAEQKGKEALERQRERAEKAQRELMTRYQESRAKAVESRNKTAMRHKIKGIVSDLNKLLLNPTKDQHVPIGLQLPVAEALDAINMDTMNAEERVAYYNDLIAKSSDPDEIEMLTKKRDFFEYRDANFKERITALKNAYAEFKKSDDPLIKNAHNEAIEDLIENTADLVGKKSLKDMSLAQLEAVYDMYKAILATVRNSNKMFKEGRQATVTENSEAVKAEVREVGGHKDRVLKLAKFFKKFGWNMLKPVTAMKV